MQAVSDGITDVWSQVSYYSLLTDFIVLHSSNSIIWRNNDRHRTLVWFRSQCFYSS